jgi:hypothetical protein
MPTSHAPLDWSALAYPAVQKSGAAAKSRLAEGPSPDSRRIMSVSKQLTDVILCIMKVFMARYIEPTLGDLEKSKVIIENAPNADEVNIPYFSNRPRKNP